MCTDPVVPYPQAGTGDHTETASEEALRKMKKPVCDSEDAVMVAEELFGFICDDEEKGNTMLVLYRDVYHVFHPREHHEIFSHSLYRSVHRFTTVYAFFSVRELESYDDKNFFMEVPLFSLFFTLVFPVLALCPWRSRLLSRI